MRTCPPPALRLAGPPPRATDRGPPDNPQVVENRIIFMPEEDDEGRRYRFTGHAGIERLILATPPVAKKVVTPGGYSEGWNASLTFCIAGVALAA